MAISRRSVLRTFAASIVPVIHLRPDVPDEKLLLAFCSEDEVFPRFKCLEKPFGIGDLTYASDRFAMVRCELANRLETEEVILPQVQNVWKEYWQPVGGWQPLDADDVKPVLFDEYEPCPECHGRRVSLGPYFPEFSDPAVDAEMKMLGYDIDDNTVRDKSCPVCQGRRVKKPNVSVVAGVSHSYWRMKRIMALPNVKVCRTSRDEETILFRADGFEGISKGLTKE